MSKWNLLKGFAVVVTLGLLLTAPAFGLVNCSKNDGSPYNVGWSTDSVSRVCCYEGNNQWYYRKIQGINYYSCETASCGASAPCDTNPGWVPIEAQFGGHVAKFAWRLDAYSSGNCPNYPATRWENIVNSGGNIHACPQQYISLFYDCARV